MSKSLQFSYNTIQNYCAIIVYICFTAAVLIFGVNRNNFARAVDLSSDSEEEISELFFFLAAIRRVCANKVDGKGGVGGGRIPPISNI